MPNDWPPLPQRWLAALQFCPFCDGALGEVNGKPCPWCDGTGDYFGALLRAAYEMGLEDAELAMRRFERVIEHTRAHHIENADPRKLKARLGLPY